MQGEYNGEVLVNPGEEGDDDAEVRSYKILVLGNSGAGKTSLVRRSVRDYFSRDYRLAPLDTVHFGQQIWIWWFSRFQTTMINEHCSMEFVIQ